ncbi:hypothetical protein SORBI_3007G170200 [Sorghum bicolor]|uniref:Uncharacterized protein n=1 Tax=Sorghum bicolor TaxID=4558 RepID=A0A1B6PIH6_SORBI|nr:hypothetical protein SORBI_3007G170200 [Sorghum bicolor]
MLRRFSSTSGTGCSAGGRSGVLMQPWGEASSAPGTAPATAKVMPTSGEACASAGTMVAGVPPRRRLPEQVSMHSSEAYFSLAGTVAVGVPERWPKAKRSGSRVETSKELPKQGHAATDAAAANGSGAPQSTEQERCAESAQQRPVLAVLCYAAVAGSGSDPSTSAVPAKETIKTPSPNSLLDLDYGARESGASSTADDAVPILARPPAKRKGTGALESVVGDGDGEGCSSPTKRGPVAQEKPMLISVEPNVQSEIRAPSGKGAPLPFPLTSTCFHAHRTRTPPDLGFSFADSKSLESG